MARVLHQPVPAAIAQLLPNLTAIANTDGLTTVALVATPTGGTAPYTYSWTVNGSTTGIADATAASTTYTPTTGGQHAARCVVTDALGVVAEQTEEWVVGEAVDLGAGSAQMVLAHTLDLTALSSASWSDGVHTVSGVDIVSYNAANADALGPVEGSGVRMAPKVAANVSAATRTGPILGIALDDLITGHLLSTPMCIQVVYDWITPPSVATSSLRVTLTSEEPLTTAGSFEVGGIEDYNSAAYREVFASSAAGTGTIYATAGVAEGMGIELLYDGSGVTVGRATADPGVSPAPAPGTWDRVAASATASDVGPIAWFTRRPGTAPETPANGYLLIGVGRDGTGNACDVYIKAIHCWVAL